MTNAATMIQTNTGPLGWFAFDARGGGVYVGLLAAFGLGHVD